MSVEFIPGYRLIEEEIVDENVYLKHCNWQKNRTIMTPITSRSLFQNTYEGACKGALYGAAFGAYLIISPPLLAVAEMDRRARGGAPNPNGYIALKGDCEGEQAKDFYVCNAPKTTFTSFAIYTLAGSTICGAAIGAVAAASKDVFARLNPIKIKIA
jgi:hypothetical protein